MSSAEVSRTRSVPTLANQDMTFPSSQVWGAIDDEHDRRCEGDRHLRSGAFESENWSDFESAESFGVAQCLALQEMARARFGMRVGLKTTATRPGLAEARFGAAKGSSNVFYAAVGNEIGVRNYSRWEDLSRQKRLRGGGWACLDRLPEAKRFAVADRGDALKPWRRGMCWTKASYDLNEIALQLGAWLGSLVRLLDPGHRCYRRRSGRNRRAFI